MKHTEKNNSINQSINQSIRLHSKYLKKFNIHNEIKIRRFA
jgi:hypothetical protein